MCAPRRSLPWNKRYIHTFGDLVVSLSRSRCLSLMGRILMKQYIRDCVSSKFEYCAWHSAHLFSLDHCKYVERPDGERVYIPCPTIKAYETPHGRSGISWHHYFTSKWDKSRRLLMMVSIRCATCGEDTEKTMADDDNVTAILYGDNFYCRKCSHKVLPKTYMAAKKGLPANWTDASLTWNAISALDEILIIAKQLSSKDVTARAFNNGN